MWVYVYMCVCTSHVYRDKWPRCRCETSSLDLLMRRSHFRWKKATAARDTDWHCPLEIDWQPEFTFCYTFTLLWPVTARRDKWKWATEAWICFAFPPPSFLHKYSSFERTQAFNKSCDFFLALCRKKVKVHEVSKLWCRERERETALASQNWMTRPIRPV